MARTQNLERSLQDATGLTTAEMSEEWMRWLRRRYWPDIGTLDRVRDEAKLITDHRRDLSYFNVGPEVSPDGNSVVFLSDRSGYADVYIASTLDGAMLEHLVKGERTDAFEQMHILRVGFSWSPDGSMVCFCTKAGGGDAIQLVRTDGGGHVRSLTFNLDGVYTPVWSPDGDRIAFIGTKDGASELYITDLNGETLERLTDDYDDERDLAWSPDGTSIAFTSDRSSPLERGFNRSYDVYAVDVETRRVTALVRGPGLEKSPTWSPDGRYLIYSSDRLGTPDLYMADLEDSTSVRLTSLIGGAESPSWSRKGDRLVFAAYEQGGWDVAVVKSPLTHFADAIEDGVWFPSLETVIAPEPFDGYQDRWVDVVEVDDDEAVDDEVVVFGRDGEVINESDDDVLDAAPEAVDTLRWSDDALASLRLGDGVRADAPELPAGSDDVETGEATEAGDSAETDDAVDAVDSPETGTVVVESEAVRRARRAYSRATGEEPPGVSAERQTGNVERYTPKFTPDWIDGGFSYSSAYGFGGTAEVAISDILGNHRFHIASDFFSSFKFTNALLRYEYLAKRINYSFAVYSYREYYHSNRTRLGEDLGEKRYFTERNYGLSVGMTYPLSHFSRLELDLSGHTMTRQFAEENEDGDIELTDEEVDRTLLIPSLRFVNDTTLWGSVGPISGGRSSFEISKSVGLGDEFSFLTGIADFRRYTRIGARHSLATKLVLARSSQADAQTFYVGGVNTIRGYDDFDFSGHNVALLNMEFRYPFIDYLSIASPLPLTLWGLRGVMFVDLGAAWDDDFRGVVRDDAVRFKDIKASYGIGTRIRFGYFIIRYDLAWPTDLQTTGDPVSHFAIGAEF
ncbi:BamA/TamA family outer membrane protein [bacterium]|nr:BamA/TamA family outer membrane protein [bacterium]